MRKITPKEFIAALRKGDVTDEELAFVRNRFGKENSKWSQKFIEEGGLDPLANLLSENPPPLNK